MAEARLELYFVRHADAGDAAEWGGEDARRPLSPNGRHQTERLAAFLAGIRFAPDAIVSSPKLRALQTAETLAAAVSRPPTTDDRLAGGFTIEALTSLLDRLPRTQRLLLVGHDPDFSSVVGALSGAKGIRLATCTLARVDVEGAAAAGRGSLRWLIPPDALETP